LQYLKNTTTGCQCYLVFSDLVSFNQNYIKLADEDAQAFLADELWDPIVRQ